MRVWLAIAILWISYPASACDETDDGAVSGYSRGAQGARVNALVGLSERMAPSGRAEIRDDERARNPYNNGFLTPNNGFDRDVRTPYVPSRGLAIPNR